MRWVGPQPCYKPCGASPLGELVGNPGSDKSVQVMQVMPKMKKIIVADLQKAYDGR